MRCMRRSGVTPEPDESSSTKPLKESAEMQNGNEMPGKMDFVEVKEMSESDKEIYSSCKLVHKECTSSEIQCVSVNENNEVAVSVGSYINVYDPDGKYLYGYYAATPKPKYISLHDDYIEVYVDIYRVYFTIDKNGTVDHLYHIKNSTSNQKVVRNLLVYAKVYANEMEWNLDDAQYYATDVELKKTDNSGTTITIYKMSENAIKSRNIDFCIAMVFFCLLVIVFTFNIIWKISEKK